MEYSFLGGSVAKDEIEQIIGLYRAAGWWSQSDDSSLELVRKLISGSHCFVVCKSGNEIVGSVKGSSQFHS